MINKIGQVWEDRTTETQLDALRSSPRLDVDQITSEASRASASRPGRAVAEGRGSAAGDITSKANTELIAMVDLFIAHPDDDAWWRPILSSYVNVHEAEVIRHIPRSQPDPSKSRLMSSILFRQEVSG